MLDYPRVFTSHRNVWFGWYLVNGVVVLGFLKEQRVLLWPRDRLDLKAGGIG